MAAVSDLITATFRSCTIEGQQLACPTCGATRGIRLAGYPGPDAPQRHCPNGHSTPVPALTGWDLEIIRDAGALQTVDGDGSAERPYEYPDGALYADLTNDHALRTGKVRL